MVRKTNRRAVAVLLWMANQAIPSLFTAATLALQLAEVKGGSAFPRRWLVAGPESTVVRHVLHAASRFR